MFLRRIMMVVLPKCTHNSSSTFGLMTLVASLFLYFQNIPFQPFPQFRQFLLIYYYLDSLATLTSPIPPPRYPPKIKTNESRSFYWFVTCICFLAFSSSFDASKSTKGASKLRRDLINTEIGHLRDLLPLPASTRQRLSQLQLMALVCVYVRKANYFQQGKQQLHTTPHSTPKYIHRLDRFGFDSVVTGAIILHFDITNE